MDNSRLNRYEKRRKNTQTINILVFLAAGLLIVLFLLFAFTKSDQENNNQPKDSNQSEENKENHELDNHQNNNTNNHDDKGSTNADESASNEEDLNDREEDPQPGSEITALPVEDENVISAFTKNWPPIGTEQEEPHVMQFNKETKDWEEMERALKVATELDELIIWWLGNDGDQRAVGTVTSMDQTEIYRVYISWITNEGWQPTKVEVLLENDQHRDHRSKEE